MTKRGLFLTVEGVEGVGKSTNIELIQNCLKRHKIPHVLTREPGGTPVAEAVRDILLNKQNDEMTAKTELMLVFAARCQHVETLIKPALEAGKWVVCDRFTDSTYAYQGGGRELSNQLIEEIDQFAIASYQPDFTVLLDLPIQIGLERANQRGELDRFEIEDADFFQRVRSAYLTRAEQFPARFQVFDASQPLAEVQRQIEQSIGTRIAHWQGNS